MSPSAPPPRGAPEPLVSVIIPAYNAAETLGETLRSALNQEGLSLELLVVDDGSTDGTAALAEACGPPVRVIRQANAGVGGARNRGMAEARGRWVAFLDGDDVWEPDKLRLQLALLDARGPACGFCYTGLTLIDQQGLPLPPLRWTRPGPRPEGEVFRQLLLEGNPVATSSVLVRRELFDRTGLFSTDRQYSEDYDMWLRLARWTRFCYLNRPLLRYRTQPTSFSHGDPVAAQLRSLRVVEATAHRCGMTGWRDRLALRARRAGIYHDLGYNLVQRGRTRDAAHWFGQALREAPTATPAARQLLALLVPRLYDRLRDLHCRRRPPADTP